MIGKRIKTLRDERGISQAELAAALGVSRMTVNNYENEKRVPDIGFAMNAANYFGVTVEYLSGRTEYRYKDDIEVSMKKAEELFRAMEKLPQRESQAMVSYLIETLDKAIEMEMPSDTLYVLSNCCIQMRGLLYEYDKLQKSIVPPIVELKRRKVPEDMIRHSVKDKPRAVYDHAFHMMDSVGETVQTCAKAMVAELEKLVGEALGTGEFFQGGQGKRGH